MKIFCVFLTFFMLSPAWSAKNRSLTPRDVSDSRVNTSTKKDRMVLTGRDTFGPGEKVAYANVIKFYRKENLHETIKAKNVLIKFYPKSIYADNAEYLTGILLMKDGNIGKAIQSFDSIIRDYPKGNKRAAALFAKSIAYKKLNLKNQAVRYFKKVIKSYPGSLESQRAWVELRLMSKKG